MLGNKMTFAGMKDEVDRRHLLFLLFTEFDEV